jgi:hypothetical protein
MLRPKKEDEAMMYRDRREYEAPQAAHDHSPLRSWLRGGSGLEPLRAWLAATQGRYSSRTDDDENSSPLG